MSYRTIAVLTFTGVFSLGTLLIPAHTEERGEALDFGIISVESQRNLRPQWEPFLEGMGRSLDAKMDTFFAPDYTGIIQGIHFSKADTAWHGNLSTVETVDHANRQVFAQTATTNGSPGYWSVLVVNKDGPTNNLNDLIVRRKNLIFGNGDPNSASDFLVPSYYVFARNNISVSDFKYAVNTKHRTNVLTVANK